MKIAIFICKNTGILKIFQKVPNFRNVVVSTLLYSSGNSYNSLRYLCLLSNNEEGTVNCVVYGHGLDDPSNFLSALWNINQKLKSTHLAKKGQRL